MAAWARSFLRAALVVAVAALAATGCADEPSPRRQATDLADAKTEYPAADDASAATTSWTDEQIETTYGTGTAPAATDLADPIIVPPEPGPEARDNQDPAAQSEPAAATQAEPDTEPAAATQAEPDIEPAAATQAEQVGAAVTCGEGLTLIAELVTDTDTGCRPEVCENGRAGDGNCLLAEEIHPHDEEEPAIAAGAIPVGPGEAPVLSWQESWSGTSEGTRPLPEFTDGVQAWSDWCFFELAPAQANSSIIQQRCAIELSFIGLALEWLDADEACVLNQYREAMEMVVGQRLWQPRGWYNCASAIDDNPLDDQPSPYFDPVLHFDVLGFPADRCHMAVTAAGSFLEQQGIWNAEWRC